MEDRWNLNGNPGILAVCEAAMTKITITMGTHVTKKWQHTTK